MPLQSGLAISFCSLMNVFKLVDKNLFCITITTLICTKSQYIWEKDFYMNRLVIIGNGFDLAHGLPTLYRDFIDDLWSKIVDFPEDYNDLVEIDNQQFKFIEGKMINNYSDFLDSINDYKLKRQGNYEEINWDKNGAYAVLFGENTKRYFFRFTNYFFETINNNLSINNWVDIENEYYRELKIIIKSTSMNIKNKKRNAIVLNSHSLKSHYFKFRLK
jgi:hypothetical protein